SQGVTAGHRRLITDHYPLTNVHQSIQGDSSHMAMTKVEAAKLTQDLMVRGVIDTIVKDSQLFQVLPFMDVTGTAVTYNRENTNPAATFYDVGDTWSEATPTF